MDLGYPNVHWYRHCTEGCEEPPLSTQGGAAPLVPWSYLSISYLVLNLHEELWVLPKTCLRSALCSILRLVCIVESLRTQLSGNPPRPPSPPPPVALVPGLCPPRPFDGTRPFPITCCLLSFPLPLLLEPCATPKLSRTQYELLTHNNHLRIPRLPSRPISYFDAEIS